jgi:hypothetical protein
LALDTFSLKSAAEMMERDAVSQSSTRGHRKFDWLELGINAATNTLNSTHFDAAEKAIMTAPLEQ